MNIILTCAGRRNYLVKYFKECMENDDMIIVSDMQFSAPSMVVADLAVVTNSLLDPNYISELIQICNSHKVDAIISLNDLELPLLAKNKAEIEKETLARVLVSDAGIIDICFDKYKTIEFASKLGIATPMTFLSYNDALKVIEKDELKLPVVIKPRWGSASIGLEFPQTLEELGLSFKLIGLKLDRTILGDISQGDPDHAILIQQKINGREFGLDIINDLEGNHQKVIVKEKLSMRSGETDKAKTVQIEALEEMGRLIGTNLGHIGNLDCDIMEDNGVYYLIEMNPRFGGGYPFSHEAGANLPKAILDWLKGAYVDPSIFDVQKNVIMAKHDNLIKIREDFV